MEFPQVTVSVGGPGGPDGVPNSGPDSVRAQKKMRELCVVFQVDPTQQLAYKTIVSEVMRNKLMWHTGSSDLGDPGVPVPVWWTTFVSDAVRSILLSGYFVYRKVGERAGVPVCVVADPADLWVRWHAKTNQYVVSCTRHKWRVGMVEPPLKSLPSKRVLADLSSSALRAEVPTLALRAIVDNWLQRDRFNSAPAVFTKVSDELKQQNGSDRQWFRNVNATDAMSTRAQDIDANFHTLVHRRAETIEQLDALTNKARARNTGSELTSVGSTAFAPKDAADHAEHIISDGRDFVERRALTSMADAKMQMDELRHAILFAFGVPPQALGKNINSERIASSNRLTEMALTTYTSFINLLRSRIGEAIRVNTATPKGGFLDFSCCLTHYELDNVQHFLVDSALAPMLSRTFDIPLSLIDTHKVVAVLQAELDGGGGGGQQAAGRTSGKRARTEVQSAALKRAKASTPHNTS